MCYDSAQLAYRIYKDAIRCQASPDEILELKKKWESWKEKVPGLYHANGFNHPKLIALISNTGKIDVDTYSWGLIPNWVKDEAQAMDIWNKTLIARGESIFEKPSFRESAKKSRCVIPLDGFYEHYHKGGKTFPFYIRRRDKESLLVGGLTSEWVNELTGEIIKSMAIVTTPGNELLKYIHNNPKLKEARMPLILEDEDARVWLEGDENDVMELIKPNSDQDLEAHTVRRLRGSSYVGNCEEAQKEYTYDELVEPPTLF